MNDVILAMIHKFVICLFCLVLVCFHTEAPEETFGFERSEAVELFGIHTTVNQKQDLKVFKKEFNYPARHATDFVERLTPGNHSQNVSLIIRFRRLLI